MFSYRTTFVALVLLAPAAWGLVGLGRLAAAEAEADKPARAKKFRAPDSVYVGTPHDVVMKMMELAELKSSDLVYDLGCGDGRIVAMAAKFYGCKGLGVEIDPKMVKLSRATVKKHGVESLVKIERDDVFLVDLQPADCLLLYLLPSMNVKLIPQIEQMRPGTRIVAHDYGFEGYEADQELTIDSQEDNAPHVIYVYRLPLKPAQ